jgi:hypothetical protein
MNISATQAVDEVLVALLYRRLAHRSRRCAVSDDQMKASLRQMELVGESGAKLDLRRPVCLPSSSFVQKKI